MTSALESVKNRASTSLGSIFSRNMPPGDLIVPGFIDPSESPLRLNLELGGSILAQSPSRRKFQNAVGESLFPGSRQARPMIATGTWAAFGISGVDGIVDSRPFYFSTSP